MSRRQSRLKQNRQSTRNSGIKQRPFSPLRNPYRPMEIVSGDQLKQFIKRVCRYSEILG